MASIGERIYAARRREGFTQQKLADKLGVTTAQIARWEDDIVKPNQASLGKLEKQLGPLDDFSGQIRDFLERYPVTVPDIANAAGLGPPTIYNLLNGKVQTPQKSTVVSIRRGLESLRKKHKDEDTGWDDEENNAEEEIETGQPLAFLAEGGLGKKGATGEKIKSIRLFNPYDERQASNLPSTPGVYLFYAGDNDLGTGTNDPTTTTIGKLQLVGTPEYIGETRNIKQRIEYWKKGHEENEEHAWWFRKDWITLAAFIEIGDDTKGAFRKELETLLIKLLSPQHNKKQLSLSLI